MKIVRYNTKEEAESEAIRLITALGLPDGMTYGKPFEIDGEWALKVKENGSWPSINAINGVVEDWTPPEPVIDVG